MDTPEEKTPNVPAVGSLGVVNKRVIVWGPGGLPQATSVPTISKAGLAELSSVALSLPYKLKQIPEYLLIPLPEDATARDRKTREDELLIAQHEYEAEKEFEGMSNAEVMSIRIARAAAGGDLAAADKMLDRVLGRPMQSIESKSVSMTYADVLKEKAARAAAAGSPDGFVEAEVVQPPPIPEGFEDLL
jgi:hypothetical protein